MKIVLRKYWLQLIYFYLLLSTLEIDSVENDFTYLEKKMKESFHIMFYGLEMEKSSIELIEEIFREVKLLGIKLSKEDIFIMDEQSIISNIIPLMIYI